ncbi:MAG TPA: FadR/GntR family transcriptional regulator [Anaeromyxobacter sp.]|nr:FadR/GntR family transcriptional regulator [Anaeromyxobacter sp.]
MPIQTVDTDRLYRKIARQLSDLIAAGEFTPGQRLPAERELAGQLGVSRPSVREALIALEIAGKVEVRVGSGVFVAQPKPQPMLPPMSEGEGPFELLEARRLVEGETAAWAAKGATEGEIAEIRAAVDELERRSTTDLSSDLPDRDFHLAIARSTHNGPLVSVVHLLWDQGRGELWRQMEKHFETPALRAATVRDHRAVYKAIEAHDPRAARTAMHRHLDRVAEEFARGFEARQKGQQRKPPSARKTRT